MYLAKTGSIRKTTRSRCARKNAKRKAKNRRRRQSLKK
jgi:hypothetical protein